MNPRVTADQSPILFRISHQVAGRVSSDLPAVAGANCQQRAADDGDAAADRGPADALPEQKARSQDAHHWLAELHLHVC